MPLIRKHVLITTALSSALSLASAHAQSPSVAPSPGYNHKIPDKIMTPDTVETSIGALRFRGRASRPEAQEEVLPHLPLFLCRGSAFFYPPRAPGGAA